ncbi:hypothetical protein BOTBODRAFT_61112 [Botryobasidium botryosum FD-172 SS1]|uniref:Rho-GAP domain-containing protein n=1 Tax=Botryobasidium botryosum (strain FD-172 SS1) TaxID=930990 RepID=A0A067NCB3_BOTB1|nr:hypothetical protein BOTBODRAFT_61112 [Botryobasidium botryosum FD-172 SS1]
MPDVTIESVLRQPPAPSAPLDFSLTQEHTRIDWSNSRFKRVWSRKRATSRSDGNLTDIASVLSASRNATPSPTSPHAERSSSPQTATSSTPPRSSSLRSQSPSSFQTKDHSPKLRLRIAPTGSSSTAPISPPLLPQSPRADSPPSQAPVLSSPASKLNPLRVPRVLPSSIVAKLGGRGNRASTIFPNSGVSVPEIEFKMDEMKIADRAGTRGHFKFPPPDTPTTASTSANAAPPADRMHGTAHTQMQIIATPAANPRSRPMSIAPSLPSNPRPSARGTPPPPPNRHRNNTTPSAPRYVSPPVLVSDLLSPPKLTGPPSSGSTPEPIPMRDPPPPRHPKVSIEKVAWMTTDVDSGFRSDAETIRETRVKKLSTFIHTPPPSHPSRQRINSNNANNAKFTLESVSLNTSSITRSTARANAVSAAATGGAMALELGKRGWAGMERLLNGSGSTRVRNPNTGAGSSSCPPTSGLMGRHGGGSTTSFASDSMPELMSGSMVALPSPTRVALRKSGVVFGANLEDAVWETKVDTSDWLDEHGRKRGVNCPALVVRCIQHLEKWGVDEEGIFRITGRTTHGAKLKAEFDSGADYDLRLCTPVDIDPHAVSSVFKLYLREREWRSLPLLLLAER